MVVRSVCSADVGADADVLDGQGQAAEKFRSIAELALNDFGYAVPAGERRSFESVTQRREQGLAGLGEFAAQHEQLWVEQVAEARGGGADVASGVGDHLDWRRHRPLRP